MAARLPCCQPETEETRNQKRVHEELSKEIERNRKLLQRTIKLILLGTGESGKSTMVKQMKILHSNGYSDDERRNLIRYIHANVLESIIILANSLARFQLTLEDPTHEKFAQDLRPHFLESLNPDISFRLSNEQFGARPSHAIKALWKNENIQIAFNNRNELALSDSTGYFMRRLEVMRDPNYLPNNEDILRVRVRTTSIHEYAFEIEKAFFTVVDVGGQKTERRKWIHAFDSNNVWFTTVFFVAALSDYDQMLVEDSTVNRMEESLNLFKLLLNYPCHQGYLFSSFILFLNKKDILEEKITRSHLVDYFPQYDGPPKDADAARNFIKEMYLTSDTDKRKRSIFVHYTCATDTEGFKFVFNAVKYEILLKTFSNEPLL
ncbi:hypothetical protein RvY_13596 [Ramazzottius varieornatus]|uniref:Uncharacterized protein n=1 Tax=Ramazzottius varieornatus TaxID=947166 RepID=A0A1D1VNE5_RAMVA|nr:hypothetical protein RvY_13596 [Ramazzottius varieornatus]